MRIHKKQLQGKNRYIVVGDVHGCIDELEHLLRKCEYQNDTDVLIFVGDLIGKGPESLEVLKLAQEEQAFVVMGNHDLSFLRHLEDESHRSDWRALKEQMGSGWRKWRDYISSFPKYIEFDDFIVVHAGLIPGEAPKQSALEHLCTIRTWDGKGEDLNNPEEDPPWYKLYEGEKTVVYGHWATNGLNLRKSTVGLDSGCVYGKKLSAWIWPDNEVIQVKSSREYKSPF
ncbi:MAG: hypothetical protein CL677_02705 [Bdellovibrionaceae bacterium]|nr:hypothetical protein [Pseudobdellovibrionaceae bacterium]|tara:strand:- start:52269 stop:52952 length:684 start_codon:yes stop_codon:yes gene_type:complete